MRPRPCVGAGITSADTELRSVNGDIRCRWSVAEGEGGPFSLAVTVPPNTSARVVLPDGTERSVGSGQYEFSCAMPPPETPWPPKPLETEFR